MDFWRRYARPARIKSGLLLAGKLKAFCKSAWVGRGPVSAVSRKTEATSSGVRILRTALGSAITGASKIFGNPVRVVGSETAEHLRGRFTKGGPAIDPYQRLHEATGHI